ncbi:MAG: phosphatase PAP2 family protein [Bacteroidetes bacterium]|nr:MAG: phosphatase PAP2 family protein [Bacteroidota bacterium]
MLEALNNIDIGILLWINNHASPFLDQIMLFASAKFTWLPFYLFIIFLLSKKYKFKTLLILLFVALTVTLTDQTSVHLFKNVFLRLRPCHQPDILEKLRMIKGCGGQYGFVSSHAANSFGVVVFISLLMQKKWITYMMIFWGLLVIYSRVYLGVHFPFDVLGGSILGAIIGLLTARLFFITDKRWGGLIINKGSNTEKRDDDL